MAKSVSDTNALRDRSAAVKEFDREYLKTLVFIITPIVATNTIHWTQTVDLLILLFSVSVCAAF